MSRATKTIAQYGGLGLALAIYAALSFPRLGLPGFYDDEAIVALRAQEAVSALRHAALARIPLVLSLYHGAHSAYLTAPVVALFPGNVAAFRAFFVFAGLLVLALSFLLCRELLQPAWIADASAVLLAAQATFVIGNREGAYFGTLLIVFSLASALCFARWLRGGPVRWLWGAAFLLGMGTSTLATFVYPLAAHAAALVWLRRSVARRVRDEGGTAPVVAAAAWFALGAAPMLLYAAGHSAELFAFCRDKSRFLLAAAADPAGNLRRFRAVIDGTALPEVQLGVSGFVAGTLFPPRDFFMRLFYASAAVTLSQAALSRDPRRRRAARGLAVWGGAYGAASFFTLTGWVPVHLSTFFPFPQVIVAFAASAACGLAPRPRWLAPVIIANVLFWNAAADVQSLRGYYSRLETTGGRGSYGSASAGLAHWAGNNFASDLYTFDWGLGCAVPFLTRGETTVWPLKDFSTMFTRGRPIFVVRYRSGDPWRKREQEAAFATFRSWARGAGVALRDEARFHEKDGLLGLQVYRCE